MADFVGSTACHWRSFGMPRCPPSPGSKGRADRPARQQTRGRTMTDASVSFAGNLTDDPELRHTESGIARARFRVAVSGRREQEPSFFTVIVWRDQAEHASESLSKGSRVVVVGRLQQRAWTAEDGSACSVSRSWLTNSDRACAGRRPPRPGRRRARASSQPEERGGTSGGAACRRPASHRVMQMRCSAHAALAPADHPGPGLVI
jgi:single stranded DNA-binding protein